MLNVKKRDGSIVPFNLSKIKIAIEKAFAAVGKNYNDDIIDMLALRVTADFNSKLQGDVVTVEDIQDSVEVVLIQASYVEVSKAYILYRKQHEKLRNVGSTMLDYKNTVNNYLKINDWRVKENSTAPTPSAVLFSATPAPSPPTTGCLKFTTKKSATRTATPKSISTTSACSPATAQVGRSNNS